MARKTIRRFGRDRVADPRDYRLDVPKARRSSRNWGDKGWHGDQLDTPHCVGFGWAALLHASPIRQWIAPAGIYRLAQLCDEWEGTDYDGTSVRGGAKALQLLGAIDLYAWTFDAQECADYVLGVGPMVLGTDWYEGMSEPNGAGVLSLDGDLEGGHCYIATGYNARTERFRIKNSWGREWGQNGYAYLRLADLQTLLDADGEACVATERKLRAA